MALGLWQHGGNLAKKLKKLEVENAYLKRVVAELILDKQILKDLRGKLLSAKWKRRCVASPPTL